MKFVYIAFIMATLTACQSAPVVKEEPKTKQISLIETYAKSASESLRSLAEIEQVARKEKTDKRGAPADKITNADELYSTLDFAYNGRIEDALFSLFKTSGRMSRWTISVPDIKPAAPVLVSVYGRNITVLEYLKDMGAQVGARAVISVDPDEKTIHVVYGIREIRN